MDNINSLHKMAASGASKKADSNMSTKVFSKFNGTNNIFHHFVHALKILEKKESKQTNKKTKTKTKKQKQTNQKKQTKKIQSERSSWQRMCHYSLIWKSKMRLTRKDKRFWRCHVSSSTHTLLASTPRLWQKLLDTFFVWIRDGYIPMLLILFNFIWVLRVV